MEGAVEQSPLTIETTVGQTPFENPAVQTFFTRWCEANDGIKPQYIERHEWEKREGDNKFFEPTADGKKALFIPRDLKLWEMVDVMEAVDTDTFLQNPQRRTEKKEELRRLGEMFEHAGIYIAQRLDSIDQGKAIAENLATEFYNYGFSLAQGKKPDMAFVIDDIKGFSVPDEELENVDRWLVGEDFYRKKRNKFEQIHADDPNKEQLWEDERRKTLGQFFRITEKAVDLQKRPLKSSDSLQPWESDESVHSAFLDKTNANLRRAMETPKTELYSSIFRRAMEALNRRMPFDKLPDSVKADLKKIDDTETNLRKALQIDGIRAWLEEKREEGNMDEIFRWEVAIAKKVQEIVSKFPRTDTSQGLSGDKVSEILETQQINCVGASMLGGEILSELGLNHLVVSEPGHSILFLITSDNTVVYLDMLNPQFTVTLTDSNFSGKGFDGNPITIADLVSFANESEQNGTTITLTDKNFIRFLTRDPNARPITLSIYKPEYGRQVQVLLNSGLNFKRAKLYHEAAESFQEALSYDPNNPGVIGELASVLFENGNHEESLKLYKRAISLDPDDYTLQKSLGFKYFNLKRLGEGIETIKSAIEINPTDASNYLLVAEAFGELERLDEAKEYYLKFIQFANPKDEKDAEMITYAKEIVSTIESFEAEPALHE